MCLATIIFMTIERLLALPMIDSGTNLNDEQHKLDRRHEYAAKDRVLEYYSPTGERYQESSTKANIYERRCSVHTIVIYKYEVKYTRPS